MEENTPITDQLKEELKTEVQEELKKRPVFLTVLCILTFIGSGLGLLFALLAIVAAGTIQGLLESIPGMGAVPGTGMFKLVLAVVLSAASLYGAVMMWQLKKIGFFLYVAAQVVMLIIGFTIMGLIFTALFIVLYALNLKHLE